MPLFFTRSPWAEFWACGSPWKTPPLTTAACGSSRGRTTVSSLTCDPPTPRLFCDVWNHVVFLSPGGITRRMVRTPPGSFPLTDFAGREQTYADEQFVAAPVKKGNSLESLHFKANCAFYSAQIVTQRKSLTVLEKHLFSF